MQPYNLPSLALTRWNNEVLTITEEDLSEDHQKKLGEYMRTVLFGNDYCTLRITILSIYSYT